MLWVHGGANSLSGVEMAVTVLPGCTDTLLNFHGTMWRPGLKRLQFFFNTCPLCFLAFLSSGTGGSSSGTYILDVVVFEILIR